MPEDNVQSGTNRSTVKLWRPVSRNGTKGPMPVQNGCRESKVNVVAEEVAEESNTQTPASESCAKLCLMDGRSDVNGNGSTLSDETERLGFSSHAVKDFLAQRWKEAIATDHVQLVLFHDSARWPYDQHSSSEVRVVHSLKFKHSLLGNAENRLVDGEALDSPTAGAAKVKHRSKPQKAAKIKYIPKQSTVA